VLSEKYVAESGGKLHTGVCVQVRAPRNLWKSAMRIVRIEHDRRRPKSAQAMAMRARIVLGCGQRECSNSEVARKLPHTAAVLFIRGIHDAQRSI